MKIILSQLVAICGALVILVVPSIAQDAPPRQICSEHPAVTRDEVAKARNASRGIRQQYLLDKDLRPPGRVVGVVPDAGGGDCPAEFTLRGSAAAAVGALRYNGDLHCSAVLVNSTMILTAAHCIQGFDPDKLEFVLGTDSGHPVQRSKIYSAEVHEDYDEEHFGTNDIAYAYLNKQMTEASPVEVTDNILSRTGNIYILHVGYGIAGAQPGVRRCVTIPVQDRCGKSFSYASANMNTCNGDSGGAAFRSSGDKLVLAGMTDWGDDGCAQFGVDVDLGSYLDWIQARKSRAPRNMDLARVEPWARKPLAAGPDEVAATIGRFDGPARFDSLYKGRWVTWDATIEDIEPRNEDEVPGTCNVLAKAGKKTELLLHQYLDGCALTPNSRIRFTGRLAQMSARGLDVVFPEAVTAPEQPAGDAVGEYVLARLTITTREVREKRARDVRLESRHGSWTGRLTECVPVAVESPWHLDHTVPITFVVGPHEHGAYLGAPQNVGEQSFCVPLWAEGYGGTQVFGATIDAGMVGFISGSVQFGVVKTETVADRVPVSAGPVTDSAALNIPLPTRDEYEVHLKLRDGKEQTFSRSGSLGKVAVTWSDGKVELRSAAKQ
jgi:hypothetical protein